MRATDRQARADFAHLRLAREGCLCLATPLKEPRGWTFPVVHSATSPPRPLRRAPPGPHGGSPDLGRGQSRDRSHTGGAGVATPRSPLSGEGWRGRGRTAVFQPPGRTTAGGRMSALAAQPDTAPASASTDRAAHLAAGLMPAVPSFPGLTGKPATQRPWAHGAGRAARNRPGSRATPWRRYDNG